MQKSYSRFVPLTMKLFFLLCLLVTNSRNVLAQSDLGRISGFVRDSSGASIANAKVTAKNQSGVERQTATNETGYYVITNIPPGSYTVTVEAPGFQRYQSLDNKLDPSGDLVVEASLTVGSNMQTIEVSASTVQLQTESGTVQKLVTREQIDSLELNGRNPIWLAALVPGARGSTLASLNFGFTQGPANFNGSRHPENLITFDGAPATRTRSNGTSLGAADVDSTQEVQILTSNYAPEYGRTSGAVINAITRSGTNNFHGTGFFFDRDKVFDARNFFDGPTIPPFRRVQFGGSAGGPIIKDKTFIFANDCSCHSSFISSGATSCSARKYFSNVFSSNCCPTTSK